MDKPASFTVNAAHIGQPQR